MRKIAVIPAYEPPESFADYAAQLLQTIDALVVVNDGSGKNYDAVFGGIEELSGATVLSYDKNMGKGYALKPLKCIPRIIDEQTRKIYAREPVTLFDYRKEKAEAAQKLKHTINIRKD